MLHTATPHPLFLNLNTDLRQSGAMQGNPLPPLTSEDYNNLLSCLHNALSANTELQKQAEAFITSLELRPGFITALAVRTRSA
jgi:hypothetical protein